MEMPLEAESNESFNRDINLGKLVKSTSRPFRSSAAGYSQSKSTPSKPYVDMNEISDSMKTFWRGTDAAKSEKVVAVG